MNTAAFCADLVPLGGSGTWSLDPGSSNADLEFPLTHLDDRNGRCDGDLLPEAEVHHRILSARVDFMRLLLFNK